jgi:hypothetical protein
MLVDRLQGYDTRHEIRGIREKRWGGGGCQRRGAEVHCRRGGQASARACCCRLCGAAKPLPARPATPRVPPVPSRPPPLHTRTRRRPGARRIHFPG